MLFSFAASEIVVARTFMCATLHLLKRDVNKQLEGTMRNLFSKDKWRMNRAENIEAGRACRATLTDPEGHWRYASDDARVAMAVSVWIDRARRCHAIVMGREPVIRKVVIDHYGTVAQGPVFAQ